MRRNNPLTGIPFKQGEQREDGRRFWCYVNTITKQDGFNAEQWYNEEAFDRLRIKNIHRLAKARCLKKNIVFSIDAQYLIDIFPPDKRCPILGIDMDWGEDDHASSPSVDRLDPTLGYVHGNLCWISRKANALKNDATIEQLQAIIDYMKYHKTNILKEAA